MRLVKKIELMLIFVAVTLVIATPIGTAQPYGKGKYGADVPYGSQTSLSISTGSNVGMQVTPTDSGSLTTATNTVTVTSTDVVGYTLYIRAVSNTSMTNGAASLPASANGTPAALATNTWGYNTDASNNFAGITLSDVLIKTATGPFSAGDQTTITYGVKVDNSKPAGSYATTVMYTAAPQTD